MLASASVRMLAGSVDLLSASLAAAAAAAAAACRGPSGEKRTRFLRTVAAGRALFTNIVYVGGALLLPSASFAELLLPVPAPVLHRFQRFGERCRRVGRRGAAAGCWVSVVWMVGSPPAIADGG